MRARVLIPCVLALIIAAVVGVSRASIARPASGLIEGRLRPCPQEDCCFSSMADNSDQLIAPIRFPGDAYDAFARAVAIVKSWSGTVELQRTEYYAHLELMSPFIRIRDDIELLLDPEGRQIHIRVAARVGSVDFGRNRDRVEKLRRLMRER